ncbi:MULTISPECIES: NAD-dependent epimerase/dehydratase family protein [unclassified Ornithinimicrobium]|uniref:NAD-dependent epimerase/dehydratase family protein n=1 Tax=unclassified Ornithinimicrobium TaxID=2615080 RepID=UPI003852B35B
MELLILGGTRFLGRAVAEDALGRGHQVTCLARGSAPPPEGVAFVRADRDEDDGLAPAAGRTWDGVVDLTLHPVHARRAVRDLTTGHWLFVSTANVYADGTGPEPSEDAPLVDAHDADRMEGMETYGGAKVTCEQTYLASSTPAAVVRPGLIGGPGDASGRSGYWPWRFAHPVGEEVAVPDDPDLPCALVDVRDLAAWIVMATEQRLQGPSNVTGPTTPLSHVLATAAQVAGTGARARPIPPPVLAELGVRPWMGPTSMPLWLDDATMRGFGTLDSSRARAAGLRTRPLADTLRDALAYEETRTTPRAAGLTDDEERRVLEAPPTLGGWSSSPPP